MEQEAKQENEKIYKSGFRLFLIIALLLLIIFLFGGLSTGWFSMNKEVSATGMNVQAQGLHLGDIRITGVSYTRISRAGGTETPVTKQFADWNSWPDEAVEVLLPGDQIMVTAEFTTLDNGGKKIPVEFAILTPLDTAERKAETPVAARDLSGQTQENKAYFLSSQIQVDSVTVTDITAQPAKVIQLSQAYDTANPQMLSDYAWGEPEAWTPKTKEIALGKTELQDSSTFEIVLNLTFVNSPDVNQIILRGNPADNPVVPSSFWRELNVNEIMN